MARMLAVVVLLFLTGVGHAAERQTVFRDLAWGDPPEALGEPILLEEENPALSRYRRGSDIRTMGVVPVSNIVYSFFQDELKRIYIVLSVQDGASDTHDMARRMLGARYGEPTHSHFMRHMRDWDMGDTFVRLHWPMFGDIYIEFSNPHLINEYEVWLDAYKDDQAASAADDW